MPEPPDAATVGTPSAANRTRIRWMRLIEQMRQHLAEAKERGKSPDHWEITTEALNALKDEARPGELTGSDYAGLWALDGLGLRESTLPAERRFLLIGRRI